MKILLPFQYQGLFPTEVCDFCVYFHERELSAIYFSNCWWPASSLQPYTTYRKHFSTLYRKHNSTAPGLVWPGWETTDAPIVIMIVMSIRMAFQMLGNIFYPDPTQGSHLLNDQLLLELVGTNSFTIPLKIQF